MISATVAGFEEIQKVLAKFRDEMQDKIIDKAMDLAADEVAKVEKKEVPKSSNTHYQYYGGKKVEIKPGNLRSSIARIAGIKGNKLKKVRIVGPRSGSKYKYNGWYGHLVSKGTRHSKANPFHERAKEQVEGKVVDILTDAVAKAIQKINK